MSTKSSNPYLLNLIPDKPDDPLFIFLPGLDETGKDLMGMQTAGLDGGFDVRCFVIPPDDITNWDDLAEKVVALTKAELQKKPQISKPIYLCGESFGGPLALKVLEKFPQVFDRIILINCASSFPRVLWLKLGTDLLPYFPNFCYKISSFFTLPFLTNLTQVSFGAMKALLKSTRSAPKKTVNQRLSLLKNFTFDEEKLSRITQPVLLIGSENDRILPSTAEAQRLAQIFPNSQVVTLPHSGHACLVQTNVNLYSILEAKNFTD